MAIILEKVMSTPLTAKSNFRNVERVIIPSTKTGKPAMWEEGGATTSTGRATIITDRHYQKLPALYVKTKGELSNSCHALMPIEKGYKIIKVWHHRYDYEIAIFEVKGFTKIDSGFEVKLELLTQYEAESQRDYLNTLSSDAVKAAKAKSNEYHCRKPFYIQS